MSENKVENYQGKYIYCMIVLTSNTGETVTRNVLVPLNRLEDFKSLQGQESEGSEVPKLPDYVIDLHGGQLTVENPSIYRATEEQIENQRKEIRKAQNNTVDLDSDLDSLLRTLAVYRKAANANAQSGLLQGGSSGRQINQQKNPGTIN